MASTPGGKGPHGWREVIVDQPFTGNWLEMDMNLGRGHSTIQGTKFTDCAGGFSYSGGTTGSEKGKAIVHNRSIYWRTLNDTLELTELSLDFNLTENQVRYVFMGSPIVGPISIQETEANVIILVATVTSVNRYIFTHPKRLVDYTQYDKNNRPSIFHQICNKPQMNFRSFNLYDQAVSIPVPLAATCQYIERGPLFNARMQHVATPITGECVFAFSFESGSINVYKISREDVLIMYDLRQSNLFSRFLSLTTSIMRTPQPSNNSVTGLSLFCGEKDTLQLVTLAMNGQLSLWSCSSLDNFTEWNTFLCGLVDKKFASDAYTDSCMVLRKSDDGSNGLPKIAIYLPGDGFRVYKIVTNNKAVPGGMQAKYILKLTNIIDFMSTELMDFCYTGDCIFTLVSNPEEDTDWEIMSYRIGDKNPRFVPALLEPLPEPNVEPSPPYFESKEFYSNLIFGTRSFTSSTIIKALSMFRKEDDESLKDKDWESLKLTAMNMLDREIQIANSNSEYDITDEEFCDFNQRFWVTLYNSCVEYHVHTVKPLGLFFESNTQMLCVVKKNRISFLRPTSFLETLYYFPQLLPLTIANQGMFDNDEEEINVDDDIEGREEFAYMAKYLEMVRLLEATNLHDTYSSKIQKRLREDLNELESVCKEVAMFLFSNDPCAQKIDQNPLVATLLDKIKGLGGNLEIAMKKTLEYVTSWDENNPFDIFEGALLMEMDRGHFPMTENFMGSRTGALLTYRIVKQLMQHRFELARDTLLLQYIFIAIFSQTPYERVRIDIAWEDQLLAKSAASAYWALLDISEDTLEPVTPFIKERGLKVANILKMQSTEAITVDGLGLETKVLEAFCLSGIGSLATKRLTRTDRPCSVVDYCQAMGRTLWTNSPDNRSRPLEDFLIVSCQYSELTKYAQYMASYFDNVAVLSTKYFYLGLCKLCQFNEHDGVNLWKQINLKDCIREQSFCKKILHMNIANTEPAALLSAFYVRAISILQSLEYVWGVEQMAFDGLMAAKNDPEKVKLCSLAFKCALQLGDYNAAYNYIMQMPGKEDEPREKFATLRMFVGKLVRDGALDVLVSLRMDEVFSNDDSVRQQVESILFSQANLSDPLVNGSVYEMLYGYHLAKGNFERAAGTVYNRAMRIGERGSGFDALELQTKCLLDVVTCLNVIEPKDDRKVMKKTGSSSGATPKDAQVSVSIGSEEVERELLLVIMLCKLGEDKPVKPFDFERRAIKAVEELAIGYHYDDAIALAQLWNLDVSPVIRYFTDVCCNLVYNIQPEDGDIGIYFVKNDISELPQTDAGYTELGLRMLENYLKKCEKPVESTLHEIICLKFLAANIELPQWLVASYKKRNVAQYLRCLTRYGEYEKGAALALKILDAALGRIKSDEFDQTVKKISTYDPIQPEALPLKDINQLAGALGSNKFHDLHKVLKERCSIFCKRVIECTKERKAMYAEEMDDFKRK